VFVASARLFAQVISTPYQPQSVYCPDIAGVLVPDWVRTSRKIGEYCEYVKKSSVTDSTPVGQMLNGKLYPPCKIAPFLDVSALGMLLQEKPSKLVKVDGWAKIEGYGLIKVKDPTYETSALIAYTGTGEWSPIVAGVPSGTIAIGENYYGYYSEILEDVQDLTSVGEMVTEVFYKKFERKWGRVFEVALCNVIATNTKVRKQKRTQLTPIGRLVIRFKNQPVPLMLLPLLESLSHSPLYKLMEELGEAMTVTEWDRIWRLHSVPFEDNKKGKRAAIVDPHDKGIARQYG